MGGARQEDEKFYPAGGHAAVVLTFIYYPGNIHRLFIPGQKHVGT